MSVPDDTLDCQTKTFLVLLSAKGEQYVGIVVHARGFLQDI